MLSSRRKFMITLTSFVMIFALTLVTTVAIFAAVSQTVKSNVSVYYTATDVSATVRANYILNSTTTPMLTEDGASSIVFRPDSPQGASFAPQPTRLTSINNANNRQVNFFIILRSFFLFFII